MKFRYARHTDNLALLVEFYTKVLGLKVIGEFENHSEYNGVFLGYKDFDWHIEFTESNEPANHKPDKDDLMVFYIDSKEDLMSIKQKAKDLGYLIVKPKNPYWQRNGIGILDPDGFGIILTVEPGK